MDITQYSEPVKDSSASEAMPQNLNKQQGFGRRNRTPVLTFLVLIITVGIVGLYYISKETKQLKADAVKNLSSIADLKVGQISNWNRERLEDAKQIQSASLIQLVAAQYLSVPDSGLQAKQLLQWMESYQRQKDYSWIALLNKHGKVLMSIPSDKSSLSGYHDQFIQQTLSSSEIVQADIHADPDTPVSGIPEIHLSYWVPVVNPNLESSQPIGVWVFQIDPAKYLFPLVESWPSDSKTAETLLVRREGKRVVYLNNLRFRKNTSLRLTYDLAANPNLTSTRAVIGSENIEEGLDYRGEKVIFASRKVPGTSWFMVAKIDKDELFSSLRGRMWLIISTIIMLISATALAAGFVERRINEKWLLKQLELEKDKNKLQKDYQRIAREWKTTFDSISDQIWLLDIDNRIIQSNQASQDIQAKSGTQLKGLFCWEIVHGTDTPIEGCPYQVIKQTKSHASTEMLLEGKWVEVSVDPILDESGTMIGAVHIIRDISAQKKAQAQIVKLNRVYAVISQINQMVVRSRSRDEILQEACKIAIEFGKFRMAWIGEVDSELNLMKPVAWAGIGTDYLQTPGLVSTLDIPSGKGPTGKSVRDRKPVYCNDLANDPAVEPWRAASLQRGYRSSIALPMLSRDKVIGAFCLFSEEPFFFNDAELVLLEEVTGDIVFALEMLELEDKRQASQQALVASEYRFRELFDNMSNGVSVYEPYQDGEDFIIKDINKAGERITKSQRSEIIGRRVSEVFPDLERKGLLKVFQEVFHTGKPMRTDTHNYIDNKLVYWLDNYVLKLNSGEVIALYDEITQRKIADEALRKLNDELEHRIAKRTEDLLTANKELETFAYSVSHDLRSPLRTISGWSVALREDYQEILDQQAMAYLDRMNNEAERMGQLIDSLLNLSRLSILAIKPQQVDLSALANIVVLRLQEANPDRVVETFIQQGITATGDSSLLEVVLTNLLNNAWKFTGKHKAGRIEFGKTTSGDESIYHVSDNGVGFDMSQVSQLFGAFQRLHKSSDFPGTGVGLATVQRIINRHGGKIWVESAPEMGASFYFTLGKEN